MDITKININGLEYEIVDKAAKEAITKLNEPYITYPSIKKDIIELQSIASTITDGFEVMDYPYFYFTSTNGDRVLYTKAGNTVLQNMVFLTRYLSNVIEGLDEDEVITIHYGY